MKMWYVVQSNPQKEMFLWEQLYLRGIETYYPSIRVRPVNPRARKLKPYFPGYLFVRLEPGHGEFCSLRWVPGAVGLVSFGDEAAVVPDDLIQTIRQKVDEINALGGHVLDGLKPGVPIIIREGLFCGYHGIFDARLSDQDRARVLIELLKGRQVRVELPIIQIEQVQRFQA